MASQLKMIFEGEALQNCSAPVIPEGFTLTALREGEEEKYIKLLHSAGFDKWDRLEVENARKRCLENGICLLVENSTGRFVSCAYCNKGPVPGEEGGGILGMVATAPEYRGHHYAAIVCQAVMYRFKMESYTRIALFTDEERLPALKTYLKLGWKPVIKDEESRLLWQKIREITNCTF